MNDWTVFECWLALVAAWAGLFLGWATILVWAVAGTNPMQRRLLTVALFLVTMVTPTYVCDPALRYIESVPEKTNTVELA